MDRVPVAVVESRSGIPQLELARRYQTETGWDGEPTLAVADAEAAVKESAAAKAAAERYNQAWLTWSNEIWPKRQRKLVETAAAAARASLLARNSGASAAEIYAAEFTAGHEALVGFDERAGREPGPEFREWFAESAG